MSRLLLIVIVIVGINIKICIVWCTTVGSGCVEGLYINQNYLYSLKIPYGLHCETSPYPSPNHGCEIHLKQDQDVHIWVDATYNTADYESALDYVMQTYMMPFGHWPDAVIQKNTGAVLGGMPAESFTIKYTHLKAKIVYVQEILVVFRDTKMHGDIIYIIGINAPECKMQCYRKTLEEIISSWFYLPES